MSIGENQNLLIITGGVQQKNAQAAHERLVAETSTGVRVTRTDNSSARLTLEESLVSDTASISRPGIVALESTQAIGDESVIRDKDTAGMALADSTSRIVEHPRLALQVQANQTPQQVLALLTGS